MDRVTILPPCEQHIEPMVRRIRMQDQVESLLFTNAPLRRVLRHNIAVSTQAYTVCLDGEPALMFGVAPIPDNPRMGSVWLRATTKAEGLSLSIRKLAPKYLKAFLQEYPGGLFAACMADDNELHQRWLRSVGFHTHHVRVVGITPFLIMSYV